MSLLFLLGLCVAAVNAQFYYYSFVITEVQPALHRLTVYGNKNPNLPTQIFTYDLLKILAGPDVLRIDVSSYPIKLYVDYPGTTYGPFSISATGASSYSKVQLSLSDNTGDWNKITLYRGSTALTKGKRNLLHTSGSNANFAHGILQTGTAGFVQGKFPICDKDYPFNVATVNTIDLSDSTKNTLSCEYVSCSIYQTDSSEQATANHYDLVTYVANATSSTTRGPNRMWGLATGSSIKSANCNNYDETINVFYAKNSLAYYSLFLYVVDHSDDTPKISGKYYMPRNSYDPPQSTADQASIDLGLNYPTAQYNDAL